MNSRRNIFLWVLYDFANSPVSIVFFLYFAQWVVIDKGVADIWFNITFTISALLLLLTVPLSGVLLDKYWRRITGLRFCTLGTVFFYAITALLALSGNAVAALFTFTLGLYTYLLTFTFYTPLLTDIASVSKRGRVSGYGVTANYLGQFLGLVIALPFANGAINFFGGLPRAETLLPSVIVFFVLSLPTLLFFKEPKKEKKPYKLLTEAKDTFTKTKELFRHPGMAFFLLAFFLFNDAILTASNNFPIFLEQVWGVSDTVKTYLLLAILVGSAIGGTLSGFVADRFGHKRTLLFVLSCWVIILPAVALLRNFTAFVIVTAIMGIWFAANWTVSRSVMAYVAPSRGHNLAFAYYGLVERASSFVGPIVWGLIVSNLVSIGSERYRIAALVVSGFIVFGIIALRRVPDDRLMSQEMGKAS